MSDFNPAKASWATREMLLLDKSILRSRRWLAKAFGGSSVIKFCSRRLLMVMGLRRIYLWDDSRRLNKFRSGHLQFRGVIRNGGGDGCQGLFPTVHDAIGTATGMRTTGATTAFHGGVFREACGSNLQVLTIRLMQRTLNNLKELTTTAERN